MCERHSDSERFSDWNILDPILKGSTSDQRPIITPPAKTYIAVTAQWRSAHHTRRRMTYNPGITLIEASTPLHQVRRILEDEFHKAPKGQAFGVTSFIWRCWSVENNNCVRDEGPHFKKFYTDLCINGDRKPTGDRHLPSDIVEDRRIRQDTAGLLIIGSLGNDSDENEEADEEHEGEKDRSELEEGGELEQDEKEEDVEKDEGERAL
ncbi:hypothetical protein FN846DRAFT_910442 [Sphaerosporella brunnea]|uniref:Uncharacterized protein n=1 Tax=Sphaerosporella brunnea TaxID=1250544 RepID=A0A5J5ENH5_9PEZI|nr:hypothetical protein FN846DRAFT_910442 [Sphaerosporella brunnea]